MSSAGTNSLHKRQPLFVFTDPGIDDAVALAMVSLRSDLDLFGACGVDGNVPADLASTNTLKIFNLVPSKNVPVFRGPSIRTSSFEYPVWVHGRNGLGNVRLPRPMQAILPGKALNNFLKRKKSFKVLSLGPLTALSTLLEESPEIAKKVSECVIMGGAIERGNVTPYAEFNIYADPEAADKVFRADLPKVLIPLDITEKVCLFPRDLALISGAKNKSVRQIVKMLKFYFDFQRKKDGFNGGYMHDPTALVALIHPALFRFKRALVEVDTSKGKFRGRTVARFSRIRRKSNTMVACAVNVEKVRSVIIGDLLNQKLR